MTITIEAYEDDLGLVGEIVQDKFSSCYRLEVLQPIGDCHALMVFKGTYLTIPNARRAMRRQMTAPITKTYSIRNKHIKEDQ